MSEQLKMQTNNQAIKKVNRFVIEALIRALYEDYVWQGLSVTKEMQEKLEIQVNDVCAFVQDHTHYYDLNINLSENIKNFSNILEAVSFGNLKVFDTQLQDLDHREISTFTSLLIGCAYQLY